MTRRSLLVSLSFLLTVSATHRVGDFKNGNEAVVMGTGGNRYSEARSEKNWTDWLWGLDTQTTRRNEITRGEDCNRKCDGSPPKICYFRWVLERYSVLNPACRECRNGVREDCLSPQCVVADGFIRGLLTANRQLGGPSIQVCKDDTIMVEIENNLPDLVTSIHWHGLRQIGSPHMDGVPMVTQCPIQTFTRFTYTFKAAETGTFFWHTHQGTQKLDGLTGSLIIRDVKDREVHGHLYDEDLSEHVIFVQDWTHLTADQYDPGYHDPDFNQVPDAVLINGYGRLSINGSNPIVPLVTFNVESGKRYRFRLIGGTCMTCAYALTIEKHRLLAISADGGLNFKATPVDSIAFNSADRFDFVLEANQTSGSYYVLVQSVNDFCNNIRQVAILQYNSPQNGTVGSEPSVEAPANVDLGVILNLPNSTCTTRNESEICMSMLSGEEHAPTLSKTRRPYIQYHITFGVYSYQVDDLFAPNTYQRYEEPTFGRLVQLLANNVSFRFPSSPMLSQWSDIPGRDICSRDCFRPDREKPCTCANVLKIPYGATVDLLVIDTGTRSGFDHPFHLHGYNFFVLEMGIFGENVAERQREIDEISLRASRDEVTTRTRAQKDTISIPARGYALLRFIADNPGYWLMHCHFLYHIEHGMALVFKVGNRSDMPPPPRGFPKCGNFPRRNSS